MGTTYSIRYVSETHLLSPTEMQRRIESELAKVNQQMSTYIKDSEVSMFSEISSTEWFSVSSETAQVINLAQEISDISNGAFDVTIAPIVDLWGFGPVKRPESTPSDKEVDATLACVGYKHLQVRLEPPAIKKTLPALRLDLSAIAKGHAVDRIGRLLLKSGVTNCFVEIGGEIATNGTRPDGKLWQVGIEKPQPTERAVQSIIGLRNAAIATSGDYRNYIEREGQRFSHTMDPTTGRPVTHQLASASVVADNCALADAIATAMMVLGPDDGLKIAEENDWAVMLIRREDDQLVTNCSSAFAGRFPGVCISDEKTETTDENLR